MGIIECAEKCKYQKEGYCLLETLSKVNSSGGVCPYFIAASLDNGNCLTETPHTN